jgi:hypothetical protein
MAFVKIVNAEGGSDARYDVNAATPEERRQLDGEGRPLSANLPDQWTWTPGLPGARGGTGPGGGGGISGGGGGDLTASPYYQQYQSQLQAAQAADLANTKSALQQLLIQFGLVPEGFQDKYGALDDTIRQLIQKNTDTGVSQYARLMESKTDARNAAIANLAKRGLTRSGAKGYALRRGSLDFNRALSDAMGQVLGNANQLQGGYAQRDLERQSGLASLLAQLAAAWRPAYTSGRGGGYVPQAPQVPQATAPAAADNPWDYPNPNSIYTGQTIGGGETQGGYGTAYGPAQVGQGGGFTSPKKPLVY